MMYWYGNGMSGWGYALMTISMVLFWGALIAAAVALVRYFSGAGQRGRGETTAAPMPPAAQPPAPEQLLAERFARGEIDEDEYRRRLDVLHGRTAAAP